MRLAVIVGLIVIRVVVVITAIPVGGSILCHVLHNVVYDVLNDLVCNSRLL